MQIRINEANVIFFSSYNKEKKRADYYLRQIKL
jgi:hypothetical protein